MTREEKTDIFVKALETDSGREALAESMIMPLLSPEARMKIRARRDALNIGCIEVKNER